MLVYMSLIITFSANQQQRDTLLAYVQHFLLEERRVSTGTSSQETNSPRFSTPPSSFSSRVSKRGRGRPRKNALDGSARKIQPGIHGQQYGNSAR